MSIKQGRVNDRIQQILSELLLREVSDPRLHDITVTEVNIDAELMYAKVYVNALGDESRKDVVLEGLKRANGYLRREVGKRMRLRNTPELHFYWDKTLARAQHINELIDTLEIPPEEDGDNDE